MTLETLEISTDLNFEPTDEMGIHILTPEATEFEVANYVHNYLEWLKRIGYISDKPFDKYMGHHYCDLILSGTIPSSSLVYQACERFKWELANQNTPNFMYRWDEQKAINYNRYAEGELRVKGKDGESGQLVHTAAQHFNLGNLYGWVDFKGDRRYRYAFYLVPRGAGKTTDKWGIATSTMQERGKKNANVIYFAGTDTQSEDLFAEAKHIIENSSPRVRNWFKVNNKVIRVNRPGYKSNMRMASSVSDSSQGKNLSLVIVDEVHTFKPHMQETIKTLQQGMIKNTGSLILFSSTRSQGTSEMLEDMVSDGVFTLEMYKTHAHVNRKFYYLAQIEDIKDLFNFNNWIKANIHPHMLDLITLIDQFKEIRTRIAEQRMDSDTIDWLTQHFNFRDTSISKAYVHINTLAKNNKTVDLEDFKGKQAYLGIDLGGAGDFTSVVTAIPHFSDKQEKQIIVEHKSFLTDSAYKTKLNDPMGYYPDIESWYNDGYLDIMPDLDRNGVKVYQYILEQIYKYKIQKIAYDPAGFDHTVGTMLRDDGYEDLLYPVAQTGRAVSEPLRSLYEDFFRLGNVVYNNDPLLTFFIKNAQLNVSSGGLWTIGKPQTGKTPTGKANIDGLAALQDAHASIMDSGVFVRMTPHTKKRGRVRVSNRELLKRMKQGVN